MLGFFIFMLIVVLLVPLIMLVFGAVFVHRAPKKINFLFGYRTERSMKSKDTWRFAHRYIGHLWLWLGGILLPLTVALMLLFWFCLPQTEDAIGLYGMVIEVVQMGALFLSIPPTEAALRRTFDENGIRKHDHTERSDVL